MCYSIYKYKYVLETSAITYTSFRPLLIKVKSSFKSNQTSDDAICSHFV